MDIREFLGVELPVIQAPMAGVQDNALAVAVSSVGGLGSLPCATLDTDQISTELATIKSQTDKPFNVNFFCHTPAVPNTDRESQWRSVLEPYFLEYGLNTANIPSGPGRQPFSHEVADVIEEYKPAVVSFHFGLPEQSLLKRVKTWKTKILASATTVEEAQWLEAHGADGIIAQGLEAGGHRGIFLSDDLTTQVGSFALLPQILKAVNLPVIAAGGIADTAGVKAALSLGAIAVQIGTAYLLCPEAKTSPVHRAAIKSGYANHTAITNLFSGRPARSIVNRIIREIGPMNNSVTEFPLALSTMAPLKKQAESRGVGDFSALWCGQNITGCKEISASALTRELVSGV